MKNIKLKLCMTLCLLGLGFGSAGAQKVKFTLNHIAGYQSSTNHDWAYYSNLPYGYNTDSHWGYGVNGTGNSWNINGDLPNNDYKQVLQRYNKNSWAGEMFDWFSLEFKNPAYTSIKYKVIYKIMTSKSSNSGVCRAALFNYNTNYSGWNGHQFTSSGFDHFRTANGARKEKGEGELSVCIIGNTQSGDQWIADHFVEYDIDNSEGTTEKPYYRYLGMSSSKTVSSGTPTNTVKLWMYYNVISTTYYKILTYQPGDGVGSALTQKIASTKPEAMKPASTFTRKNHIFAGWKDGHNSDVYAAGTTCTPSQTNYGPLTLTAQWTPVKFTLMNGSTQVAQVDAAEILTQLDGNYKPTAGANQFFAGYYTQEGGKGIQVYDSNLNPTTAGQAHDFTSNTTLYAHFVSTQHTVMWDYTYRNGEDTYANLPSNAHARYCRLQIKNASEVIKTIYLTAPSVTNKETTLTSNISTHTTASTTVNFAVGNSSDDDTSGETATIHFTQAELESIHECNYVVWSNTTAGGSVVEHWVTETNLAESTTLFKWEGYTGENMFDLKWTVTLKGLNMYPDKIFVKPMVKTGENYREITPMNGLIGEECEMVTLTKNSNGKLGEGSSATYTGEYVVLKKVGSIENVPYKVGMTGFYLNGQEYFLNPTHGTVATDFISGGDAATENNATISYEINDYDIPVVLLLPAAPDSGIEGATVNGLDMELYVDQDRTTTVNLSRFKAERPNFTFLGWFDKEWNNKTWAADAEYEFHTHDVSHNGGTRTLVALWQRDSKPEASVEMTEEAVQFKYTITATDNVEVKAVKYLISDADAEVTAKTGGWTTLTATDDKYVVLIDRNNDDYGKYLYVMVENEGQYEIVKCEEPIRSFIDITAKADPRSAVEDGSWEEVGEGENANLVWKPNGKHLYTYYSTFYDSQQAYKLVNATAYKVEEVSENALSLEALAATEEDGNTTSDAALVLPKGEAVILRSPSDKITLELVRSNVAKSEDNKLEGVDSETSQENDKEYFVLSYTEENGLGFYLNKSNKLAAHKAYVCLPEGSNVRGFALNFGEGDSIVNAIRGIEATETTGSIYDLSGRKVSKENIRGGVYIKSGSKIMH